MASCRDTVDHYSVLGLPSGEEGSKLSLEVIMKAYRTESLKRHPDRRPDDPNATADFQRLASSFEVLRDEASRKALDARLRTLQDRILRDSQQSSKRRKLGSDLDERERAVAESAVDPAVLADQKEKKVAAELQKELADFNAMLAERRQKKVAADLADFRASDQGKAEETGGVGLDKERVLKVSWKERVLKVSWKRTAGDYDALKLRELFERFGGVEDFVIRLKRSKKWGSALVIMSSKEPVVSSCISASSFKSQLPRSKRFRLAQ